jgi:hypothetical protein
MTVIGQHRIRRDRGHGGLADAARPDQRHKAPLGHLPYETCNDIFTTDGAGYGRKRGPIRIRWKGRLLVRRLRRGTGGNRRHEAVTATRDGRYIAGTAMSVAKTSAEHIDVHPEIAFLDKYVGPDLRDQLILADNLAGALHQRGKNCLRAAAERNLFFSLQQKFLCSKKAEGAESNLLVRRDNWWLRHTNLVRLQGLLAGL